MRLQHFILQSKSCITITRGPGNLRILHFDSHKAELSTLPRLLQYISENSCICADAATMFIDDASDVDPPPRARPELGEDRKLFFINGDEMNVENICMYRQHGFHPIVLGEVLPKLGTCESDRSKAPQYRILQKLGFGAFATVWLARDLFKLRYVAVKVCCGVDKPVFSRETKILRHIKQSASHHMGFDNILTLHEAFIIAGPNGFHECLVTEVVAPLEGYGVMQSWPFKDKLKQLATAVSLLHLNGIAHGDLHSENCGVAVPGLQDIKEETIMDYFLTDLEITPVIPYDPSFPRDTVPSYMTPSVLFGAFLQQNGCYPEPSLATFKVLDFGRAYAINQPPRQLPGGAPFTIRPPEAIIYDITDGKAGAVWGEKADIWTLARTMPGTSIDQNGFRDLHRRLENTLRVGGPPPAEWLTHLDLDWLLSYTKSDHLKNAPSAPTDHLKEKMTLLAAERWNRRALPEDFVDLMQGMLKTDPNDRLDIAGVLAHPWLSRE